MFHLLSLAFAATLSVLWGRFPLALSPDSKSRVMLLLCLWACFAFLAWAMFFFGLNHQILPMGVVYFLLCLLPIHSVFEIARIVLDSKSR